MKKRGQITLFIILGIVLLVATGIFIYIKTTSFERKLTPELIPAITQMPLELRPIRVYTEDCIYELSEDAFGKLGDKGGYIDLEQFGVAINPFQPTEADGLQFSPDSSLKVPYWWYLKSSNDCKSDCYFTSLRPPLYREEDRTRSIEAQVDDYVNKKLKQCLDSYSPFEAQGFEIQEAKEVKTKTLIGDYDVSVFVEYPIEIKKGDVTYEIERFYISLPIEFKRMYEMATEIANSQINYSFLEKHTLNLITAYASLDSGMLPPIAESEFNFGGGKFWSVPKVKEKIEMLLMNYIPGLQVFNSLNYERIDLPGENVRQALYDQMVLPINFDNHYQDFSATFDYLSWWPIYFDAGDGGVIQSESISMGPIMFGWQNYATNYDISFPILVTIKDPDALNEKGYELRFALEANMRNNDPIDKDYEELEGIHIFQPSLLCNQNQRNSGNISIKTIDGRTQKPLPEVYISYTCGEETCTIGITDENGRLEEKFPVCYNGIITFLKPDYFAPSQYLTTELDKDEISQTVVLYPFVDKDVQVMKYRYSLSTDQIAPNPVDIGMNEQAVVTLKKIKESDGETDVYGITDYWGDQTGPSTMRLVPGIYEAKIMMFLHEEIIIPEETRKTGAGVFGKILGEDEEYTIPEVKFDDNYPSGGAVMNDKTGYLVVRPENLYDGTRMVMYAIAPSLPKKVEDLDAINKHEEYSGEFRSIIEPDYLTK